jgi:hypothetical protein
MDNFLTLKFIIIIKHINYERESFERQEFQICRKSN